LDDSAGHRKSTRTRKGAGWLKTVLVAASMLTAIDDVVRDGADSRELGPSHFEWLDRSKVTQRLV
jgi:hypothetical protein